jgi:lipopolysaccharide transport system ATP-binding protein
MKGFGKDGRAGEFWALRDVGFEVSRGEMLGVIGANGAGKSTLLRILAGVMRPEEGGVRVQGRIGGLLQLGVGFHPDLTGRENVFTNGIVAGLTAREVAQRFDSIVAFAELGDFIDNPLRTYSTGMRMRLGFATAAHTDADVLLIDEVLTVGDLAFQQKCLQRIERYKSDGCAVVFVTHSLEEVGQHCERTLWLRSGRMAALGPSADVIEGYRTEMIGETRRRTPSELGETDPERGHLVLNENRFGSLEMRVEGVRLLDPEGNETDEIDAGDPLTVEISFHAPAPIHAPIVSVSISDEKDVRGCDVSTEASGLVLPTLHGKGTLLLHLERLDLTAGAHYVSVGIHERAWAYAYDFHWRAYPFTVSASFADPAPLAPPRRWELRG